MPYNIDGTGKPNPGGGGGITPGGKSSGSLGGSPGLLTSTGGLGGLTGACYQPIFNPQTNSFYISLFDPLNFDTEEDGNYFFPEPDSPNGVGRKVSIHKVILTYRELGKAQFTFNITTYISEIDDFKTVSKVINIAPPTVAQGASLARINSFPDKKIHTKKISLVIDGERPKPWISRQANSGPLSVIKCLLCGNADEKEQL